MGDKLKLTYFDGRGRGELTRLVFAYAGKEYVDERIPQEKWPEEKPKQLFGWLPILTVGEVKYCDSMGIAKYAARECGNRIGGASNLEMLQTDMVLGMVSELLTKLINLLFQTDQTTKKKMEDETYGVAVPKVLGALEQLITRNGGRFFVGASITVADIAVFDLVDVKKIPADILEKYPHVKANVEMVATNENIAKYVKNRALTMF